MSIILVIILNCSYLTHGTAVLLEHSFPGAIYYIPTDEKRVALTIDDGPDSLTTRSILAVLERYQAKATFFLISSYAQQNPGIVRDIVRHGHELGNHMTRDEPSTALSFRDFKQKFDEADSILSTYAEIRWFRPGSGKYNRQIIDYISQYKHPYKCALGSVYPLDVLIPSSEFASSYIQLNVKSGSIIILHDHGKRGFRTIETLKSLLPALTEAEYKMVTLTELYHSRKRNL